MKVLKIYNRIKEVRKKIGLTQTELAEIMGKSPTFISLIESGKRKVTLENFLIIMNILHHDVVVEPNENCHLYMKLKPKRK